MAFALNPYIINRLLKLWSKQGSATSTLIGSILQLFAQAPVDMSAVLGPALLIAQAYCEAQRSALAFIMDDTSFATFSSDLQGQIANANTNWGVLAALAGNIAFSKQLPRLDVILQTSPAARYFGATGFITPGAVEVKLESFLSVPTASNITTSDFWQYTSAAIDVMSRLLAIDYVLSTDLTFYYGPNGTIQNIYEDIVTVLTEITPQTPNVTQMVSAIGNATPQNFSSAAVVSIRAIPVPQNTDIQTFALRYLGDASLWVQLASFNNMMYPYFSDDPIQKLGRPEASGFTLSADLAPAATTLTLNSTTFPFYNDQRILLQNSGNFQVVTITGVAGLTITFAELLLYNFPAADTAVSVFAPVYDTGVVYGTGDKILIPSTLITNTGVLDTPLTDVDRFGTDIRVGNMGQLLLQNGDIELVSGDDNLVQALQDRFKVPAGELTEDSSYGNNLRRYLGHENKPYYASLAAVDAVQTCLQDPRVVSAVNPTATITGDQLAIDVGIQTSTQRLLLPVTFNLSIQGST